MNVLVFESDATQTEAIRHVVCDLVGARLTVATSIEQVLRALRDATPDLVLLPPLVSPSQEARLLETLRSLPSAAHVETQIAPMLPPREEALIVTPGWRRWTSRRAPTAQATTPAESSAFAEGLHWTLERVRERKLRNAALSDRQALEERRRAEELQREVELEAAREEAAREEAARVEAAGVEEARVQAAALMALSASEPDLQLAVVEAGHRHASTVALLEADDRPASVIERMSLSREAGLADAVNVSPSLLELFGGLGEPRLERPRLEELELADATSRLLKKLGTSNVNDRRQFRRFAPSELPGLRSARIKFGPNVALVDVSAGGALLETDARLQPESEALLELVGSAGEAVVPFRVLRCQIAALNGTPRYLGACVFKEPLDLDDIAWQAAGIPDLENRPALTLVPSRVAIRNAW